MRLAQAARQVKRDVRAPAGRRMATSGGPGIVRREGRLGQNEHWVSSTRRSTGLGLTLCAKNDAISE